MKDVLKYILERLLFVAVGFGAAWFIQEANQRADEIEDAYWSTPDTSSHQVPVVNIPPAVVRPNPAPAKPRLDLTDKRRVDSLIAICDSKDSLTAPRDSVIVELSTTQFTSQTFVARKDSILVMGHMDILYFPLDHYFLTEALIDSLSLPESVIRTLKTVHTTSIDWGWTAAVALTAVIVIEGILYYFRWKTR